MRDGRPVDRGILFLGPNTVNTLLVAAGDAAPRK
jgi:hypothetical protein